MEDEDDRELDELCKAIEAATGLDVNEADLDEDSIRVFQALLRKADHSRLFGRPEASDVVIRLVRRGPAADAEAVEREAGGADRMEEEQEDEQEQAAAGEGDGCQQQRHRPEERQPPPPPPPQQQQEEEQRPEKEGAAARCSNSEEAADGGGDGMEVERQPQPQPPPGEGSDPHREQQRLKEEEATAPPTAAAAVRMDEEQQPRQQGEKVVVDTLYAQSLVLVNQSTFFRRLLAPGEEDQEDKDEEGEEASPAAEVKEAGRVREITVTLQDEAACGLLRRLVALAHTPCYKVEQGKRLPQEEVLALLPVAHAFGFEPCLEELLRGLEMGDDPAGCVALFNAIPEPLLASPHVKPLVADMSDYLACELAPMAQLWQNPWPKGAKAKGVKFRKGDESWRVGGTFQWFRLDERVRDIPVHAMEAILTSEVFEPCCENYCFSLVQAYCERRARLEIQAAKEAGRPSPVPGGRYIGAWTPSSQAAFDRLAKTLKWKYMTKHFLHLIVAQSIYAQRAPTDVRRAAAHVAVGLAHGRGVPTDEDYEGGLLGPDEGPRCPFSRKRGYKQALVTHVPLATLEGLLRRQAAGEDVGDLPEEACYPAGVLQGFPLLLRLTASRHQDGVIDASLRIPGSEIVPASVPRLQGIPNFSFARAFVGATMVFNEEPHRTEIRGMTSTIFRFEPGALDRAKLPRKGKGGEPAVRLRLDVFVEQRQI